MTALIVIGIIAAVIALIMCISLGIDFNYEDNEIRLCVKICGVLLQIFPKDPEEKEKSAKKEKKQKKPKKKKEKQEKESKETTNEPKKKSLPLDISLEEIFLLIKKVLKALGHFTGRIQTDRLMFHYLGGGSDPHDIAVKFAYLNAAIDAVAPAAHSALNIHEYDIRTDLDFMLEKTKIDFGIAISLTIGSVFRMIFAILNGAIGILIKNRIRVFKEKRERKREEKQASVQSNITEEINN